MNYLNNLHNQDEDNTIHQINSRIKDDTMGLSQYSDEEVISHLINYVRSRVKPVSSTYDEYEDLVQDCLLKICLYMSNIKNDRYYKSYVNMLISSVINDYFKKKTVSIEDSIETASNIDTIYPNNYTHYEYHNYIEKLKSILSVKEQFILDNCLLGSLNQEEVSFELNISQQRVSVLISSIKIKFEKLLENEILI